MSILDNGLQQSNEIAPFEIGRKYLREEMISKVRELLESSKCHIDSKKCRTGINGLYEFYPTKRGVHSNSSKATDIVEAFC